MRVAAPAEHGRANEAVLGLLASTLGLPRDRVTILSGSASQDKVVRLGGMSLAEAERALESAPRRPTA